MVIVAPRRPTVVLTPLRLKFSRTPGNNRTLRRNRKATSHPPMGSRVRRRRVELPFRLQLKVL
jgi:hypothetical protein